MLSPTAGRPIGAVRFHLRQARRAAVTGVRLARWTLQPDVFPTATRQDASGTARIELRLPVESDADPALEAGKRVNLALAARAFDGLALGPDRPLSFCRVLGPITAARGFQPGRELRGGCVIPSLGGGVCLLSNALFELGARLGWDVLERHGHTVEAVAPLPGRAFGLDATVRWPDVDLRLRPLAPTVLRVRLEGAALVVQAFGDGELYAIEARNVRVHVEAGARVRTGELWRRAPGAAWVKLVESRVELQAEVRHGRSCLTCGEDRCHERPRALALVAGAAATVRSGAAAAGGAA